MFLGVPEPSPACLAAGRGKSLPGGKEATVISIIITIAAVIAITVTVTIRFKRR
jgi:hypothetical protein